MKKEEKIVADKFYSTRELARNKEFAQSVGVNKIGGLTESSLYAFILKNDKIKKRNLGAGKTPYYKILGADAIDYIKSLQKKLK